MKKLLSIILAILMIVATIPMAFAVEETPDYSDANAFTAEETAGDYDCSFVKNIILRIVQIILDLFDIDFDRSSGSDDVMIGGFWYDGQWVDSLVSDIPEENGPPPAAMPQPGMY